MTTENTHRTLICSVLFLDIVGYSKQPVARQMVLKDAFNRHISDSIKQIAEIDRVILDTGDGASICFMGDPEDALFSAIALRDAFHRESENALPDLLVRIGINLGPIKQVQDINGQRNILGDGINVAQRVMSFADPNQILVSRSYFEVVSCMSQEFSTLFQYMGSRADKHVREHVVYEVRVPGAKALLPAEPNPAASVPNPETSEHEAVLARQLDAPGEGPSSIDATQLEQARLTLARYIGPLASLIIKRAAPKARDIGHLYELLRQHIEDPAEREQFSAAAPATGVSTTHQSVTHPNAQHIEDPAEREQFSAAAPATGVSASHQSVTHPDAQQYERIKRELSHAIGPLANIILKREAKIAPTLRDLCNALARQIDDANARTNFLEAVKDMF